MSEAMLVALAMAVIACGGDDGGPCDAQPAPDARTFDVPVGEACADEALLCASGLGVCVEAVCRRQCRVGVPRCAPGEVERHDTTPQGDRCVCVPR